MVATNPIEDRAALLCVDSVDVAACSFTLFIVRRYVDWTAWKTRGTHCSNISNTVVECAPTGIERSA